MLFDYMRYKSIDFSLVNFRMSHDGCWSILSQEFPVRVHTLIGKPQKEKNRILGLIEIRGSVGDIRRFLRKFGAQRSINSVISITNISGSKHHYKILFTEKYENMVTGLLDSYSVLYQKDIVWNGYEYRTVVIPREEVNSLKRDLQGMGDISDFKSRIVDEEDYLDFYFSLSENETKILKIAYKGGYYELPKRTFLEGISSAVGLSKSTVEEHLRKAENKIISFETAKYFDQN